MRSNLGSKIYQKLVAVIRRICIFFWDRKLTILTNPRPNLGIERKEEWSREGKEGGAAWEKEENGRVARCGSSESDV